MGIVVPIELVAENETPTPQRKTIVWGSEQSAGLTTDLDWWMTGFGTVSDAALTLARVGCAAFLADRAVRRNALRQRREIHLITRVPDPALAQQCAQSAQDLLGFVTGDRWRLEFEADTSMHPTAHGGRQAQEVSLLSGGLDSFCGAVIAGTDGRLFLSHSDASVIKHSQNQSTPHIPGYEEAQHVSVRLAARHPFNREPSRRSRSILFIGLGVALADASGVTTIEVPENGFTSLNPPLAANRGGVLTTRSTHPMTFHLAEQVLADLGLKLSLRNPYEWLTKGELISMAADSAGPEVVQAGLSHTLSCAKSNLMLKGKTFGRNCGLDYACMVRRAGVLAAGLHDTSAYECHTPGMESAVEAARTADIAAIKTALRTPPTMSALLSGCGPFPPNYDYERGLELWKRGHSELSALSLP